jgi:hypothetical protein
MRLLVTWYDFDADEGHELAHPDELPFDASNLSESQMEALDRVVTQAEVNFGLCIDQGGEVNTCEFDIADYEPERHSQSDLLRIAKQLLNDVIKALRDGFTRDTFRT